ncbi:hypothetical protein A9Q99_27650 [Gammaproteobacteria bacterium 45_16_T64]|nr:hypothetical protein A9Q99_27650 [Gammaproteobacteria bacterium 45_16_T64]
MTSSTKIQLTQLLRRHLQDFGAPEPLGSIGIFYCRNTQRVREVPLHQPCMIMVLQGMKRLTFKDKSYDCRPGQLLLIPGNSVVYFENIPLGEQQEFLSMCTSFQPNTVEQFCHQHKQIINNIGSSASPLADAPSDIQLAMLQRVQWCQQQGVDELMDEHRQQELLLLLVNSGLGESLLLPHASSWRQRVCHMLSLNIGHDWQLNQVSDKLAVSDSTLRRHLSKESTSFRLLLEETRLVSGLCLLQETNWPIGQIAETVGYQSQSRFGERFKRRFSMTPRELRQTRQLGLSESGERLTAES